MANHFCSKVEIGGELNEEQLKAIASICQTTGAGIDWDESAARAEDLVDAIENYRELCLYDRQARNGAMEELSAYLSSEKIPYIEEQDGQNEYDAQLIWFDGEKTFCYNSNNSGDKLLDIDVVRSAVKLIEDGDVAGGLQILKSKSVEPKLPSVSIRGMRV